MVEVNPLQEASLDTPVRATLVIDHQRCAETEHDSNHVR